MMRFGFVLTVAALSATAPLNAASASEKKMSGADLAALLSDGRTVTLGGPGEGYSGELKLSADGKGSGVAKTDAGAVINIEGVWRIKGDRFCRTWNGLDGGKEVCETWILIGENQARVMNGKKKIGLNKW